MKYLLFIVLLVVVLITAGCVGGNQNSAVTPTPQMVYVTVLVTSTPTIITPITSSPDCQCDMSGGCKEINSKIEYLIGIRQDCASEMVRRSRTGDYTSDNPTCDRYSSCTNHCIFVLQQHYNESCLSGYQV